VEGKEKELGRLQQLLRASKLVDGQQQQQEEEEEKR